MYARVPQAMAQFVLKIEKLSHIMGPTPVLEMARAYGLRPRLWLLLEPRCFDLKDVNLKKRFEPLRKDSSCLPDQMSQMYFVYASQSDRRVLSIYF